MAASAAPSTESEVNSAYRSSAYRSSAKPAETASVMPTRAINCARTEQPDVMASAAPSTESEVSSAYRSSAKLAVAAGIILPEAAR